MTAAIEVHDLTKAYRSVTALDAVSFDIEEHSITGLLGRNGVGKTTILSILAGQDRPTSGDVRIGGQTPYENPPTLRTVSYVRDNQRYPDNYRLHHVLRIAPEFAPNWDADLAADLADAFRIPANVDLRKFSRGQLSSVAIVLGLASRAPVTLLDEPYLGLDVTARGLFHDALLRDHAEHPRTVVLSTHLIEESQRLFDRVIILEAGRVAVDSAIDDLPDCAYTVSGVAARVANFTACREVLGRRDVGALAAVTVGGALDAATEGAAHAAGLQVAPIGLSDLVVAVGDGAVFATAEKGASR